MLRVRNTCNYWVLKFDYDFKYFQKGMIGMPLRYVLQILVFGVFCGIGTSGFAELRIDITQGNVRPLPIAIPNFLTEAETSQSLVKNVTAVISPIWYVLVCLRF